MYCRFGSGLTLQIKVKLSPPPEKSVAYKVPSKRFSFRSSFRGRTPTPAPAEDGEAQEKYFIMNANMAICMVITLPLQSINIW